MKYYNLIILCIVITCFNPLVSASNIKIEDNFRVSYDDTYIIKDFPYVGQNRYSCAFASLTMIYQYFGKNITLDEFLHNSGVGYSAIYTNFKILDLANIKGIPLAGCTISQNPCNLKYLALLYGLKTNDISIKKIFKKQTEEELWEDYWTKIKNIIKKDIPIITSVDPLSLPFYIENVKNIQEGDHAGHAIVIIGFNESNNTVCYNDPGTYLFNKSDEGKYVYLSKDIFRDAVRNTSGSKYYISTLEPDPSKPVLSDQEIFNICHKLNIEKMQGKIGPYFGLSLDIKLPFFGINAFKSFKKCLINPIRRIDLIKNIGNTNIRLLNYTFYFFSLEKETISNYLIKEHSPIYENEASLLSKESQYFKKLKDNLIELYNISINNSILKAFIVSKTLVEDMINDIDKIIQLEQDIIKGYCI